MEGVQSNVDVQNKRQKDCLWKQKSNVYAV